MRMIRMRNNYFRDLWEDETQREVVIEKASRHTVRLGGGGLGVLEG